jgi:hypothetical protein
VTYWIKRWCGQHTRWYEIYSQKNNNIKWITMINYGYIDFTRNFLESMKYHNSSFPLTVYCLDKKTMESLKGYSNVTCIDTSLIIDNKTNDTFCQWGQGDYRTLCFYKLDVVSHALKNNSNTVIGYIDTDIIVLKNPTQTVIRYLNEYPEINLFSQCDESNNLRSCSEPTRCPNLCAGICIFRNNPITFDLVDYKKRDISKNITDQDYLLQICNKNNIKRITIERSIFLNGSYPGVNNMTQLILPDSAELIHYNYIIGKNKIMFMQKNKMWYI